MSIKWSSYVWETTEYKGSDLLVALALADFANDEGLCHPKIETVARKARLSVRAVQYALRSFEEDGFVQMATKPGRGNGPIYQLKKVQSATEKVQTTTEKRVQNTTKGANHDNKGCKTEQEKVQSATTHYMNHSLNREEGIAGVKDDLLIEATESALSIRLDLDSKKLLCRSVPTDALEYWTTFVHARSMGFRDRTDREKKVKLGFILTDFAKQYGGSTEEKKKSVRDGFIH